MSPGTVERSQLKSRLLLCSCIFRIVLERSALRIDYDPSDMKPDALENAELGLLHLLGSFGVAVLHRLRAEETRGRSRLEVFVTL